MNISVELLVVFLVIILFLCYKYLESMKQKQLKENVAFCISSDSSEHRNRIDLRSIILNAQINNNISSNYHILPSEFESVDEIINAFQKYILEKHLNNSLPSLKSKRKISGEEFFMYMLQDYLGNHQAEDYFNGHSMHAKTVSRKDYGSWGGACYDATYTLTDFAVAYNKVYYIAYVYCKNSRVLNPNKDLFFDISSTEKILDTNQISVYRM